MLLFESKDLIEHISRYNDEYYCTIVKLEFVSGLIRVHIDERGDMSLGELQSPMSSSLGIYQNEDLQNGVHPTCSHFTVSNPEAQYLGYLDFDLSNSQIPSGSLIGFQYGAGGYTHIRLFRFDSSMAKTANKN